MAAFLDACRFNPTAGGATDWTFSSAVNGYQGPTAANAVNGRLYKYRAESSDLSQWELGEGVYNSGTGVLARTTVLFNSSGTTSKINFSTVPQVAIVALKADLLSIEEANSFTAVQKSQARSNIGMADGHIPGEASNGLAAAGEIGELVTNSGSTAGNFVSGVVQQICTLSIPTAGDWEIGGVVTFGGSGSTSTSDWNAMITTVSTPTISNGGTFAGAINLHDRVPAAGFDYTWARTFPKEQFRATGPTILYMHGQVTIGSGTVYNGNGRMSARRAR